ncbi:hypothetical protein FOC4_g10001848 [Fusarium odoratissimum]|uniref:NAD(+) ADP-ribosyltransferase n=1 Tax=Fusarium oxysporum f. sp. cubense (strain race 4) TaxID=2502994 RepID=N1S2B0_FUSC4|nr:hypothetical protein FOC4_g10001848 [Fusarium odoratissimum]
MPPRNKGVANPFAGCVITVCGRPGTIGGKKWYHQDFKTIIVKYGGRSVRNVTDATTHVVATKDSLCGDTAIMAAARRRENLSFMMPEWLIDTDTKKKKLNAKEYAWTDLEKLRVSRLKTQSAKTKTAKKIAEAEAPVKDEPKEDGEAPLKTSAKPKKTPKPKIAKPKPPAEPTTAAKTEPTTAAKTKKTPKPKTAKPKPPAEPIPPDPYHIWADPKSGVIYDAYLNKPSEFFHIQVVEDPETSKIWTRTRCGPIGELGSVRLLGNGDREEAVKMFERKFKSQSGLAWGNRSEASKPGKYAYVPHYGGDNDTTDHP